MTEWLSANSGRVVPTSRPQSGGTARPGRSKRHPTPPARGAVSRAPNWRCRPKSARSCGSAAVPPAPPNSRVRRGPRTARWRTWRSACGGIVLRESPATDSATGARTRYPSHQCLNANWTMGSTDEFFRRRDSHKRLFARGYPLSASPMSDLTRRAVGRPPESPTV
jgi:hypothetical protein